MMGEPSRVLMAAKLPAPASTATAWGGTSRRLANRTARAASPPPSAMSGISGPRTAPKARVARPARSTPGSCAAPGAPCTAKPSAGEAPPFPGRYRMARAASKPPTAKTGSGHHTGSVPKPSPWGSRVKISSWR